MIKTRINNEYKDIIKIFGGGALQKEITKVWSREANKYVYESEVEYTGPLPITITTDGSTLIDYRIYGNTVQNGTPTPENPVDVVGCGERTENIMDVYSSYGNKVVNYGEITFDFSKEPQCITINGQSTSMYPQVQIWGENGVLQLENGKTYTASIRTTNAPEESYVYMIVAGCDAENNWMNITYIYSNKDAASFSVLEDYVNYRYIIVCQNLGITYDDMKIYLMIAEGSTPPETYEPYGYKLPMTVSDGNTVQTVPVYLGEVQSTRRIGKIDLSEVSWVKLADGLWRTLDIPNIKYSSVNTELGDGIAEKYTIHTGAGMISALNCIAIDVSQVSVNTGSNTETPTGMFWYVLDTPTTGILNEPLMKIGDYADTVSKEQAGASIPTFTSTTVIDYDGAPKPSEMCIKYRR